MHDNSIYVLLNTSDDVIGKSVKYYDYLDDERFGTIVAIEPYNQNEGVVYVYISDNEEEYNFHQDMVGGKLVKYAELRLSTEVYLDE